MDPKTHILFAVKLLEVCGCDKSAAVYSIIPAIDKEKPYFAGLYAHSLKNTINLLNSSIEIFTGEEYGASRTSYEFIKLKKEKNDILNLTKDVPYLGNIRTITSGRIEAALALVSHYYLDTFFGTIQFFLPYTSFASGQWDFWDNIDYLAFKEAFSKNSVIIRFNKKMMNSDVWKAKINLDKFSLILKRRLLKEKALDKKLNPKSMMKAMIIRIGETSSPVLSYEVLDSAIRKFFRGLDVNEYIRIDREAEFLRMLEKDICDKIIKVL